MSRPSFDRIYDHYFDLVWQTLRRLGVPESALDDACQEVFLVVHRRLPDFEGRSTLRTWVVGIARRVASDCRRRTARHDRHCELSAAEVDPSATPFDLAYRAERVDLVHRALEEMGQKKREVFVLSEIAEMSGPEIASCLEINVDLVYARLRAAREELDRSLRRAANIEDFRRCIGWAGPAPSQSDRQRVRMALMPFFLEPPLATAGSATPAAPVAVKTSVGAALLSGKAAVVAGGLALGIAGSLFVGAREDPRPPATARQVAAGSFESPTSNTTRPAAPAPEPLAPAPPPPPAQSSPRLEPAPPNPSPSPNPPPNPSPSPNPSDSPSPAQPEPIASKAAHLQSPAAERPPAAEAPPGVTETPEASAEAPEADEHGDEPAPPRSIRGELDRLRAARRALHEGRFGRARAALLSHRREFPTGVLRKEREALWILLLCRSGRHAEADELSRAFRARWGDAALSASVDRSCRS